MYSDNDRILGQPSKDFFIDMITRDLSITDCILDLIDNSVDKAVEKSQTDVMKTLMNGGRTGSLKGLEISIKISLNEFFIEDNCGGISVQEARETVFRFGNPGIRRALGGLSVYGIGMKRTFFKLGRNIIVKSTTGQEWWKMEIDVEDWKSKGDEDWDFKFTDRGTIKEGEPQISPGTKITIKNLREEIRQQFNLISFQQHLHNKIGMTYALFIMDGLTIKLNNNVIEKMLPPYGFENKMTPARKMITHNSVDILIIAGVTGSDDRTPRGWYVFCNGRMVLEANQTDRTGWGTFLPKWHSKFGHFVGYVYFRSDDVRKLPWTTTKQDVVIDSPLYQMALAEMQIQCRPVLTFLSDMYPTDVEPEDVLERDVLKRTQNISLIDIPKKESSFFVDIQDEKKKEANKLVSIQYQKRKSDIDLIKSCSSKLRFASAKKIGEYTFDYFIRQECQ